MAFYNTYVNYNGNGSQQDFSVPFSYLSQSEVIVTFSGVGTYTYVFTSPNVIRTTPAVASGDSIRISRQTGITSPKTVFSNGSALTAEALNNQINQLLYGIQEFSDSASTAMNTDVDGNWDAQNKRIKNVLDPLLPTDSATKAYVDALSLSGGTISSSISKTIVNHSGTGSQTAFSLPFTPSASDFINVFISGVYLKQSGFSTTGNSIVFNTAPANGTNNIEIQIIRLLGVYVNQDVNTAQIVNGAVTTAKIADANVTTAKVADGAITSDKIADGTIATADIANTAVTTAKIADGAATLAKLDRTGALNQVLTGQGSGNTPVWSTPSNLIRPPQFLHSGTSYTTPANCTKIYVEVIGGGGGGGGGQNDGTGSAGGGGGYSAGFLNVTPNTAYSYAIGAGGIGSNADFVSAAPGGSSTFTVGGTTLTANGGGAGANDSTTGGTGGTASGGTVNTAGTSGTGGSGSTQVSTTGGVSARYPLAAKTRTAGNDTQGVSATQFGGGGAGGVALAAVLQHGGEGAQGQIIVWEFSA